MRRSTNRKTRSAMKQKNKFIKTIFIILLLMLTSLVIWLGVNRWDIEKSTVRLANMIGLERGNDNNSIAEGQPPKKEEGKQNDPPAEQPKTKEESVKYIEGQELPSEPMYIKDILIASKKYPLPSTFAPGENAEAREAFDELAAEAVLEGFQLTAFSTYRSFEYQTELYKRYVERDGEEAADRYSARPGYSEHQTGLAFDIGEVNVTNDWATERFGHTEAGKWLASEAHRYGFIMRYPEKKESITGYMYEAWHFRYVGVDIAQEIYDSNLTLEEYLGIK